MKSTLGIKKFWSMIKIFMPAKWLLILAMVLVIIETCLSLAVPLVTKKFIDGMTLDQISTKIIAVLICVFVTQLIMSGLALYTMNFVGQSVVLALREKTWKQILHLPISFFDRHPSGETMSRMTNDTLIIKEFITGQLIPFISGIISIIGSVILLISIDWKITLMMIVVIPLAGLVIAPLGKSMYKVSRSLQDETASFQSDLGRVLTDIRLVKSSLAEKYEEQIGLKRMTKLFRFGIKEAKIMAIIQPLTMSVMLLLLVVIFGYGSTRVAAGTLSAGALVAIIFYLFQISVPFSQLASLFTQFQKALGASERLNQILLAESEPDMCTSDDLGRTDDTLSFQNISFAYSKEKSILKSVSFQAKIGQMTAIVGPSGAGKTTLFSLLERFYNPNEGDITYKGKSIHNMQLVEWRKKIAYVSQDSPMMSGTIRSNLTYGLENVPVEQIRKAIVHANLEEFIDSLPDQLETEVGERGIRLSGGQRQRLAIARAMIRNPKILLLDEATAHLDSTSERLVQEALEKLMKGRTTFVIAHRLATVRQADQLIMLEGGVVTGAGTHKKLLATHPLYKELVEQQLTLELAT
ncbi:TPA: ABC transporter ATP-binding protein [Bacillus cereus]|uniref:ABC transporter ATP-binding protein n=2 Tax=Bacillus TaxID=1386 RepID=UPI0011A765BA|nr:MULTISPECIES: ABC transporter ATP-binding protein [Bacillus cereus group]KAA6458941.1 ABC transporter ATP-binding protein [Bacillus cereus]KAB2412629.1 ABC transporter ATP-binding protein [Bacillus cereus]KAB2435275.1 ABC transporter ATP-binding protein [Bacillus cereus]KAB2461757.1 ABC transporter ATP-binding protein [Bacillus cereus]HDR8488811.1 ABC transporter ATP-binding protein [Bacillus cereus]